MRLVKLVLMIVLMCSTLKGEGQNLIKIDEKFQVEDLDTEILIKTDINNKINIKNVESQLDGFKPFTKNYKTGNNFHWITFKLQNTLNTPQILVIRYEQIYADTLFLYTKTNSNFELIDSPQSWKIANEKRFYPFIRYPIFKIHLAPKEKKQVFVKLLKRDGGVLKLPFSLWQEKEFHQFYNNENLFRGFFYGWLFFVSFFAIIFYIFLKEKIYLFYSLNVFSLVLNMAATGGTINHFFSNFPALLIGPSGAAIFNLLNILLNLKFSQLYLDTSQNSPKPLHQLGLYFQNSIICFISLFFIIHNFYYLPYIALVSNIAILIFIGFILSFLIYGYFSRSTSAMFYSIAVLPFLFSGGCFILASIGVIPYGEWIISVYKVSVLLEVFILSLGLGYRYFLIRKEKTNLELKLIQAQSLIISSQEAERQRIAQDLHDEVGNSLAALKNYISQTNLELGEKINKIAQDVRNISHNLASIDFNRTTFSVAFQNLINRHNEAESIDYELIEVGVPQKLPAEKELVIYRIVCELLNNIQKHSKAQKATIQLVYEAQNLTIIVEDDGIGIKTKSTIEEGIGLKHIQTRVAYLNAQLTIDDDGKGTIVVIDVPIST